MNRAVAHPPLAQSASAFPPRGYELGFGLLGLAAGGALLCRSGAPVSLAVQLIGGTTVYLTLLCATASLADATPAARVRLGLNYLFCLWFYGISTRVALALAIPSADAALLVFDVACFGRTPAAMFEGVQSPALTDFFSACYLGYLVYLHLALAHALTQSADFIAGLSRWLFGGFLIGFIGYLTLPALGPGAAYPELFAGPLAGGPLTRFNVQVIEHGAAALGSFPSLHVLNTLLLLAHDRSACARRFVWMLLPAAGLILSTLYLRQHYAADLLAAVLVFLALRRFQTR